MSNREWHEDQAVGLRASQERDRELESLASVVREMRAAQKRYFATRSSAALAESKKLEAQVDAIVAQESKQGRLL